MCGGGGYSPPPPAPAPAPAAVAAPAPVAVVAPAVAAPAVAGATGNEPTIRRTDTSVLQANRGRTSLRIDRTQPATGNSGSGLNIPV